MNGSLAERFSECAHAVASASSPTEGALAPAARAALGALAGRGPLPLKEVATAAGIAKSTASGLAESLELQGFLQRERDPRDARRLALGITAAGRAALAVPAVLPPAALAAVVGALPAPDAEVLERVLAAVAEALRPGSAVAVPAPASDPAPAAAPGAATAPAPAPASAATPAPAPASAPAPAPAGDRRLLVVEIAGGACALPLELVREVLPWQRPRPLATSTPWLDGVVTVRGELLAVSDVRRLLGHGTAAPPAEAFAVVHGPAGPVALAVDRVRELQTVRDGTVQPPLPGSSGVAGIVDRGGGELLLLLDVPALLQG